ncbi:ion channel [Candidatus Halobeggiatoa sp. HSG11]|nr:ion channel [Candidatus Halobeggiatoa sp. HSG11]
MSKENGFIVNFWEIIFRYLSYFSLFNLFRLLFPKLINGKFVDIWVLGHLILSIVSIPLILIVDSKLVYIFISIFALSRVFEIVIYQINVLLFDEYRANKNGKKYVLHGYRRIVILLLHNYFEIIFWFATQYIIFGYLFDFNVSDSSISFFGAIYTSFVIMTTFGFNNIIPLSIVGYSIVIGQAMIGLFMTLLSLARFISLLPNPDTMDDMER